MSNEQYTEMIMEQLDHSLIKEHIERYGYYSIKLGNLQIDLRARNYTVHYVSELSLMMINSNLPMEEWSTIVLQVMATKPFINTLAFYQEQTGFEYPSAFSIECEWFKRDWFDNIDNFKDFIHERITLVVPTLRQRIENRIAAKQQYEEWKTAFYSKYYKGNNS